MVNVQCSFVNNERFQFISDIRGVHQLRAGSFFEFNLIDISYLKDLARRIVVEKSNLLTGNFFFLLFV